MQHKPVRYGLLALVGLGYGLSIARLFYESDPLRFAGLGGAVPALIIGGIGGGITLGLGMQIGGQPDGSDLFSRSRGWFLPALLPWFYVLTPAGSVDPLRGLILLLAGTNLAAVLLLTRRSEQSSSGRVAAILAGLIALAAYLITLQRTVGRADTFEFQVTAPVMGVAHPTGYPLYILLGKLFSLLPVGKMATRVNLTSAVAASAAVALTAGALRRALRVDGVIAGLAALAFGLSPVFWSQAVAAEVYALHNAFAAAILGGALWLLTLSDVRFIRQAGEDDSLVSARTHPLLVGRQQRLIPALFALLGLSLTNHLTTVLLVPAVGLAILLAWPRLSWKQWLLAVGLFCAGLLVYAYIPIRWPALHDGRLMAPGEFIGWVTGSRFSGALQLRAWLDDPDRWRIIARLLRDQYGWPGVILGAFGLVALLIRNWRAALVTAAAFAAQTFYGLNYLVPDIDVFLIPLFLIQAIWMGYGIHTLVEWAGRAGPPAGDWARAAAVTLFALIPLSAAWQVGPGFDWSDEEALEAWGRGVLSLPLDEGSAILADSEKIAPLEYLHRIEGLRPDMDMVVLGTEDEYRAYLHTALADGRTVYLQRFLPGLEGAYHLRSVGPLVEVGTAALTDVPPLAGSPQAWEPGIRLLGYQFEAESAEAGTEVGVTLYWQTNEALTDNYQVRLRLLDESGAAAWESGPAYAVSNRYPTVAWKPQEVIPDQHLIQLPVTLPPGTYRIEVALSPPFSESLARLENGGGWLALDRLEVEPASDAPDFGGVRAAIWFEGGALTGVDVPEQAPAGGRLPVSAAWIMPDGPAWTSAALSTEGEAAPAGLGDLSFVFEAETGALSLRGEALRCGWLRPLTDQCRLATVRIAGEAAAQAVANFDNQLLLTGVDFEAGRLQPGQVVDVTLHWQGLRSMTEDYTVFVHLLGPDGLLHGQIDQWPVQGTFPTSRWEPGQPVADRYLVPLDPDAPPGSYQLEIGVYLLGTNTRLPVLNADGIAVEDKVLLGGLIVPE